MGRCHAVASPMTASSAVREHLVTSPNPAAGDLRPDVAFAEDRAAALGRTGRSLATALATYREAVAEGCAPQVEEVLLDEVAGWVYRLLLQRECAGARSDNLEAIQRAYDLPGAVLQRL
jgi:hypothetical protein